MKMKFFFILLLMVSTVVHANEVIIKKGAEYLQEKQQDSGAWSENQKSNIDTLESLKALVKVNTADPNSINKALKFLANLPNDDNTISKSMRLNALSFSTNDTLGLGELLTSIQKNDGGWGASNTKQGSIENTIFATNALISSKKATLDSLSKAITFLVKNQQQNGAWIFTGDYSISDITNTAMVIVALKNIETFGSFDNSELQQAITRAQRFLEDSDDDGIYDNLVDTAWVYLALSRIKQPSELQAVLNYINNSQLTNGSWNNKIYDSAICLQALTAIKIPQTENLPNLEITEQYITFNPTNPATGNEVTISALIFNKGNEDANDIVVEFFNRDPRLDGVELASAKTIQSIPANASSHVTATFSTNDMVGPQQIVVFVDRENNIKELTKINNAAAKVINVGGMPDLSISSEDIKLSNPNVKAFEKVDLTIKIHNTGNDVVENIPVKIYDNENELSSITLSKINANSHHNITITTELSAGPHDIRVEIDPKHTIENEINITNNSVTANFEIEVELGKAADIGIESIIANPAAPTSAETLDIIVNVINLGSEEIENSFNVNLSVDSTDINTIVVNGLLGGQRKILKFENVSLGSGDKTLVVTADAENVITADTNLENNTLSKTITVNDTAVPANIEITSFTANPATAIIGSNVDFKLNVKNSGTITSSNVSINLYNNDVALSNGITIPALEGGQEAELQFQHTFSSNGAYTIEAVATHESQMDSETAVLTVAEVSDLEIIAGNIRFSNDNPGAFEEFEITAVINNIGSIDAVNIPVRFIINGETITTMNLNRIAAASKNSAILRTSLPSGAHNIIVQIDPEKTLNHEHNYLNNQAYRTLGIEAPQSSLSNLAIESFSVLPNLPLAGEPVELVATVINLGGTNIETPFDVTISDSNNILHTFTLPTLMAGQKAVLKMQTNFSTGVHDLTVLTDANNVVTEETKDDNSHTTQLTVNSSATPSNLVVANLTVNNENPNIMDDVTFTASISNTGTMQADNFTIQTVINGVPYGETYQGGILGGGGTFYLQIPYMVQQEANTIEVIVNSNNSKSLNFTANTIPLADLTLAENGLITNPSPQPNQNFDYNITVINNGETDAGAFKVLVSEGHPQMAGVKFLGSADIESLVTGASKTVDIKLNLPESKDNIFVFIDSENVISESNKDNNLFESPIIVEALPDLVIETNNITLSHNDLTEEKTVVIKAIVSNIGSIASSEVKGRFLDRRVEGTNYLIGDVDIPALKPGEVTEVQILWNASGGEHTVVLEIDINNTLIESLKTNNVAEKDAHMSVPETTLRILRKNDENQAYELSSEFMPYETVYFEILHGYSNVTVQGILTGIDGKNYFVKKQTDYIKFETSYNPPGTYTCNFFIVDKKTQTVIDEITGSFEILPNKSLTKISASSNLPRATAIQNNNLKLMSETLSRTNEDISGTLTYQLAKPDGSEALPSKTYDVIIRPDQPFFRHTYQEENFIFTEVGDYTLTTTFSSELGDLSDTTIISVDEVPSVVTSPIRLDVSLPFAEQVTKQVQLLRNEIGLGEKFDVIFMFDTTGSFKGYINQFKESSISIMEAIKAELGDDVYFGLSTFADYPEFDDLDDPLRNEDYAYMLNQALTPDIQILQQAFDGIKLAFGGDYPESQLEALYQLATGEGLDVNGDGDFDDFGEVAPQPMGWRAGSTKIVFFATDDSFHKPGDYNYPDAGATWDETVEALKNVGITLVGLLPEEEQDVTDIITETGSVDSNGDPLIFYNYDYSGTEIMDAVIEGTIGATLFHVSLSALDDQHGFFKNTEPEQISLDINQDLTFNVNFEGKVEPQIEEQIFNFELEVLIQGGRVVGSIPVSVIVPQRVPLNISVDKKQYFANEDVDVNAKIMISGNALKTISTAEEFASGVIEQLSYQNDIKKLVLGSEPLVAENIIVNGDFESDINYGMYGWTVVGGYIYTTTWDVLFGNKSLSIDVDGGDDYGGYITQDVTIPENAVNTTLSLKDKLVYGGSQLYYDIQILDTNNNLLKTLLRHKIQEKWDLTTREYDISEFKGQTIRLLIGHAEENYDWTKLLIDDIELSIICNSYPEQGSARYIFESEKAVLWDKLIYEADIPEGTSVEFRVRAANSKSDLANVEFSEYFTDNSKILPVASARFIEVEVVMKTSDVMVTPSISSIAASYVNYDDLKLKVAVFDSNGTKVADIGEKLLNFEIDKEYNYDFSFNTGSNITGEYYAKGDLLSQNISVAQDSDNFEITAVSPQMLINSSVVTNKLEYICNDKVAITSRVSNSSENKVLDNVEVEVKLLDSSNNIVETFSYTIKKLLPNMLDSKQFYHDLKTSNLGAYKIEQTVTMNNEEVGNNDTSFSIVANVVQGYGISGTITTSPLTIKRRVGVLNLVASALNTGGVDLTNVNFKVDIYDPTATNIIKTFNHTGNLLIGENGYSQSHNYSDDEITLMPGTYPVTLTALFSYGNANYTNSLDINGFTITNTAPVANAGGDQTEETQLPTGKNITLDGSASSDENSTDAENKNDIVLYQWTIDDEVLGQGETLTTNFAPGTHSVLLTVTDTCGATHTDTVNIEVNFTAQPPVISGLTPTHNNIVKTLSINAVVTDAVLPIDWTTLIFTVNNNIITASYDEETGNITAQLQDDAADGWYELKMKISNTSSLEAETENWRIGLDRNSPDIINEFPAAETIINDATPVISANINDTMSGVDGESITIKIGENPLEFNYNAETKQLSAPVANELTLEDGWHEVSISVADNIGNTNSSVCNIGIDTTPPLISDQKPVTEIVLNNATPEISVIITDAMSGVDVNSITVKIDETSLPFNYDVETNKLTAQVADEQSLEDGVHEIFITVSDSIGNIANSSWNITIDTRSIDLMLLIDTSGSMGNQRIIDARNAAETFVEMLPESARAGLVEFNSNAYLRHVLSYDHQSVITSIQSLTAGGGTYAELGIQKVRQHFTAEGSSDRRKVVIMLADGDADNTSTQATLAAQEDIAIYTIGIGQNITETDLKQISEITNGKYYYSPTSDELSTIFSEIFEENLYQGGGNN
ncbi:CARDB domain-containing protein [Lentisphaerota bacterium WC36G]|nr:VWA domain-containing protein [Lentisphaerae bacterium WC36]